MYNVDENKVSCEYLAFAKNKRFNAPTLEIIDLFDQDVLQGLKAKIQENFKNHIYDSTTINEIHNDEENDILDCYATPKSNKIKRQITPDSGTNKRRLGTVLNDTFFPDSQSQTPHSQGKKYGSRDNRGKVLIKHGEGMSQENWTNTSDFYKPEIKPFDAKKGFPQNYR